MIRALNKFVGRPPGRSPYQVPCRTETHWTSKGHTPGEERRGRRRYSPARQGGWAAEGYLRRSRPAAGKRGHGSRWDEKAADGRGCVRRVCMARSASGKRRRDTGRRQRDFRELAPRPGAALPHGRKTAHLAAAQPVAVIPSRRLHCYPPALLAEIRRSGYSRPAPRRARACIRVGALRGPRVQHPVLGEPREKDNQPRASTGA